MIKYFIRRLLQLVVVAFIISVLVFLLVHLLPGDPSVIILGPNDTAHNRAVLFQQLGLNKPLVQQYFTWLTAVFHGNLGQSYLNHESVRHIISTGWPIDLELIIISQVIAFGVAIPLALVTARRPNQPFDNVATTGTFGMLALPPFVIAPILVAVFAVGLHWFPATGYVPFSQEPGTNLHDMILPSLAITAGSIAVYYRLFRSDLISTLQEDFITMARSKGMSSRRIMWRHAFRPSSFSLLAAAGVNIGALIAGTFIVEYLFALNGLGFSLVAAVNQRDYLVVQGITLVVAIVYVVLQFIIDFVFTLVDPRVTRG
ncbi:MAG TPA: ABC transporter permease [Acidimicrobiales bacterium]|jgi:peptide/nickel transport system permease protein|nr:ABC transporter permease [Acidimicrobiales bacterium]